MVLGSVEAAPESLLEMPVSVLGLPPESLNQNLWSWAQETVFKQVLKFRIPAYVTPYPGGWVELGKEYLPSGSHNLLPQSTSWEATPETGQKRAGVIHSGVCVLGGGGKRRKRDWQEDANRILREGRTSGPEQPGNRCRKGTQSSPGTRLGTSSL